LLLLLLLLLRPLLLLLLPPLLLLEPTLTSSLTIKGRATIVVKDQRGDGQGPYTFQEPLCFVPPLKCACLVVAPPPSSSPVIQTV